MANHVHIHAQDMEDALLAQSEHWHTDQNSQQACIDMGVCPDCLTVFAASYYFDGLMHELTPEDAMIIGFIRGYMLGFYMAMQREWVRQVEGDGGDAA